MAGLVPWCFPERRYPRLWDDSYALLNSRLSQLDEWGWRDYQVEAVRAAVLAPLGRGIVSVGTGGGKSRIAWGIAYCCGGSWQYVVYGRDLVRQAKEVFSELTAKYMSEGGAASPASIEVWSWAKLPLDGTGVLVDECHMASATQRSRRLAAGRWGYRIGLSGSALDRADALNPMTVGFFGLEVARVSVDELVEDGYLAAGVVRIVYV